tara:strand:+ start:507511 stop:507954 length:444 start_codon:yes stop_codon:yes gene_type:complete
MLIDHYNKAVQYLKDTLLPNKLDCIASTRPLDRSAPYYNYLITVDKRRDNYVITAERYVDEQQVNTRFIFEKRGLSLSQSLDVIYALDKLNGLEEEQSYAYRLRQEEDVRYWPSQFATLETIEEIEDTFCTKPNQYMQMNGFKQPNH